jgi:hypothetical protein
MMHISRTVSLAALLTVMLLVSMTVLAPVRAGERLLTVNTSDVSEVFFITGEPTLVMNGFDLTPQSILRPAVIDRVTIVVDTPVSGAPSEIVIYEDANGGSPVDARLVTRQGVNITMPGSQTFTLAEPAVITQPVVWVGFYLPVDFRFYADQSGSSVLTYWAWTPGGQFDLSNLASASVLGPANGSAPVNLDMGGTARITAEITPANPLAGTPVILANQQAQGQQVDPNFAVMVQYQQCERVIYDSADENISYESNLDIYCQIVEPWNAPPNPIGFIRRGPLYDLALYTDRGIKPGVLDIFVTHCIRPAERVLEVAMIGVAYEAPRVWRILPTERYGDVVCAEVPHGGNLSLFVPEGALDEE